LFLLQLIFIFTLSASLALICSGGSRRQKLSSGMRLFRRCALKGRGMGCREALCRLFEEFCHVGESIDLETLTGSLDGCFEKLTPPPEPEEQAFYAD
jgi:hypothetical protein